MPKPSIYFSEIKNGVYQRAHVIPKCAWMDLYYDLYRQTHGENLTSADAVLEDAETRLNLLRNAIEEET